MTPTSHGQSPVAQPANRLVSRYARGTAMADLAAAGEGLGAAPRRYLRPLAALATAFAAEGDRRILWLPVFFGTGIALYFTLTSEPPLGTGLAATFAAGALGGG